MSKKREIKKMDSDSLSSSSLPFADYNKYFKNLKKDECRKIEDAESRKNSYIPIKVCDEQVFLVEPDRKLIPDIPNQQKCDFLIYCQNKPQTCFIELKGENISSKKDYNPYDQIIATLTFFQHDEKLKELVDQNIEKHAFIVSPGRQKFPRGVESKERLLWKKLRQGGDKTNKIKDLIHYVKVTTSDKYSNNGQGKIICSLKEPVCFPFVNT